MKIVAKNFNKLIDLISACEFKLVGKRIGSNVVEIIIKGGAKIVGTRCSGNTNADVSARLMFVGDTGLQDMVLSLLEKDKPFITEVKKKNNNIIIRWVKVPI